MNFKEVRLVGFKSFADATSIKFDDGVTCIVGPNGCGKSNVADAVRWVLGEQSAKTLRGSTMQDVIFSGTETRRQLSYCEVTLVFDNTDKIFDIEYDEVAMTRRLYRSGESEYLINLQPCLRRDIVTLLHGVGIGKEGYSIIGQGKVEQIITAKPEDRRAIFEEATGVIRFKSQKEEIERKLANARDNLTVFAQRMDEAEKQLRPLGQQAETARKHREYSTELKYQEVNSYLVRSDSFSQETEKYRAAIAEEDGELQAVEERLAAVDVEEAEDRARTAESDARLRSINEKLRLFEVDMEHKTGEGKVLAERIRSYRSRLSAAADNVEYSLRRTQEIDGIVEASAKRRAEREARAAQIAEESAKLVADLRDADARVEAEERRENERRESELSSVEGLADVRANMGSLSARRDAVQDRMEEVRAAIRKAAERREESERRLEAYVKEREECERFLDKRPEREEELNAAVDDLARSEQQLSEEIVGCNTSILNFTNNLEMYRNLKNRFDGYRDSVRRLQLDARQNAELGKRIKGAIADIVSTERKYEVALETAFGTSMQSLVTATQDDAAYLIRYLKETGGGIVTFLPVNGMRPRGDSREAERALSEDGAVGLAASLVTYDPYYDNVVRNLLGNTLICDDLESAKRIRNRYPEAFRIITLEGEVIATNGAMTGGSRRKDSGNLLAGERHIKECEEAIERKRAILSKLSAALSSRTEELEAARAAREEFRVKVQEETAHFAAVSQKELAEKGLLASAQTDEREYTALLDKLTRTADDLQSEVLSSSENEELLNKIRAEAAQEAQLRQMELGQLRERRDKLARDLQALRVEGAAAESARVADEENCKRLLLEKESLLQKVEEERDSIAKTEQMIEQLRRDEEKVALTEEEQHTVQALRARLEDEETAKRALVARQSEIAEEKRKLLSRQMACSEKKHAAEIEISRLETTLDNMRQRLEEAYGLTYESAQALRDGAYDITQANQTINSLRHKIAALGAVNFNAEEDYENLLARYNEMQTQREDLEKGIDDLSGALSRLRDEMQKQFDDGFREINENFTHVFKELFGGGRAEMQLDYTDCDDPLNAGVEIIACPPGKKLTRLSLLSGGEQAFTAIAILFAILKSRPMPFCILDEIEAALDEANVDRFARYLKKFSKDTQFIVITHKKPTMNRADTLFGVTMEEKGVSKIVSVKLSEVEARLGGDTVM